MALMTNAMSMLNRQLGLAAAVAGTFTWPTGETTTITTSDGVVSGASRQVSLRGPQQGDAETRIGHGERVLLLPAEALTKSGVESLPVSGLRWTETINGVSCRFQLMGTDALPKGWDWSDPSGRGRLRLVLKRDDA